MKNQAIAMLLIDDNMNDAELMIRALKKKNRANKLVHLKDGVEVLDFVFCQGSFAERDFNNPHKVIFLDLKMPRIDGLEVLERIKKDKQTKSIPIIVTSSKQDQDIRKCYDLGASSYVVKATDFDNLSKTVAELGSYWLLLNEQAKYNI